MTPLLFSVDVEDPRDELAGGGRFPARVSALVEHYLRFLGDHGGRGTFFIVGEVARRHPELVRRIVAEGHEIGCHSDRHVPLDRQDPAGFRDDLLSALDALGAAGASDVRGYRAPCFSLTGRTRWAWPVLAEAGLAYSSSVLPARSPLYGWPEFGTAPRLVDGIVELPVTLLPFRLLPVPFGGVYFRALPRPLLELALRRHRRTGSPLLTYQHPYDIDAEQPFAHPAFARWSPYGLLMRRNRRDVLPRLETACRLGFRIAPYGPFAEASRRSAVEGMD